MDCHQGNAFHHHEDIKEEIKEEIPDPAPSPDPLSVPTMSGSGPPDDGFQPSGFVILPKTNAAVVVTPEEALEEDLRTQVCTLHPGHL